MESKLLQAETAEASGVGVSAEAAAEAQQSKKESFGTKFKNSYFARNFKRNWSYLLFLIPAVVVTFVFAYIPMYGLLIAFQDFTPGDSIWGGYWIGFDNFSAFLGNYAFWGLMWNTFLLCILGFIIGFPLPIIVALMLHTTRNKKIAKFLQTVFNGPHFISLVVLVGMLYLFFGRYGLVNNIIESAGGERYSFFLESGAFRPMYILSSNWQDFGWSSIIYLAALSGVEQSQHEAAQIDGASRFQRVLHVDLPAIMPIISVMLIMSIGGLMGVGYERQHRRKRDHRNLRLQARTYGRRTRRRLCNGSGTFQFHHQPSAPHHRQHRVQEVLRELALLRRYGYGRYYQKRKLRNSRRRSPQKA